MAEKIYSRINEAEEIVNKLVETYAEVLWQVRTNQVTVLGVENKEPTKRSALIRVRGVKNAEKAILQINNVATRYIVETYWSEWNEWDSTKKEWMLFRALLSISEQEGKLIKPDCTEFRIILDKAGVDWDKRTDVVLPSLLSGNPVEFDLELRPGLDDIEDSEEGED